MTRPPYSRGLAPIGASSYAYLQPDGGWGWSNAGLVAGETECLLIDTFFDLRHTRELLAAIDATTERPIGTLVNTHHNGDHCWGNQLVEGARIVGHRRCREQMMAAAPPSFLADLMQTPTETSPAVAYARRAFAPFDFSGIEVRPPTVLFDDELSLTLDGREIRLLHFGPAHTLGDMAAFVPDEGVLFAGDLVFVGSTPLVWEGSLRNWIRALDGLLALEPETVVPGHGPVCGPEGIREIRGYLDLVVEEGTRLLERGLGPMDAARRIDVNPYREWKNAERLVLNLMRLELELDGKPPEASVPTMDAFSAMAELASAS